MNEITYLNPKLREDWLKVALCTGPINKKIAENSITELYRRLGLRRPFFYHINSPITAIRAINGNISGNGFVGWEFDRWFYRVKNHLENLSLGNYIDYRFAAPKSHAHVHLGDILGPINRILQETLGEENVVVYPPSLMELSSWIPLYKFYESAGVPLEFEMIKKLNLLEQIVKHCGWLWFFKKVCFISNRFQKINLNEQNRLHCSNGPAILFRDCRAIYAWNGVRIPEKIVMKPEKITLDDIYQENNAEIRQIMLDQYDFDKFIKFLGLKPIHQDRYGLLYRFSIGEYPPHMIVKVKNSTPDPDGNFKSYFLNVPPDIETAHQAVAWTFDMTSEEYQPKRET